MGGAGVGISSKSTMIADTCLISQSTMSHRIRESAEEYKLC